MAHIIDKARSKQHSLVVTLLDLRNAFGEVHHNLIKEVLSYHHIPTKAKFLISSLYSGFQTSVITNDLLILLSPFEKVFFKVTVLVPSYSTCVLIPSYNLLAKRNISNLAFPLMINLIVFLHQFTGSSLQMMQLLSQPLIKKISFF